MAYIKVSRFRSFINKVTANIDYKIELLFHEDKAVSKRAFISLLAYSRECKKNVAILCDKKIVSILVELMKKVDSDNLALVLQNLLVIMHRKLKAALQLINVDNMDTILEINKMFLSNEDNAIRRFCSNILTFARLNDTVTCHLLSTDVMAKIFDQLKNTNNIDMGTLIGLLEYLYALFLGSTAKDIIVGVGHLRLKILFVYIRVPRFEVQNTIFHIIRAIISWKDIAVMKLLSRAEIMENMFNFLMDNAYKQFHYMALIVINTYCVSEDSSAYYFIESDEFKLFCEWVKTCGQIHIVAGATFFNQLTSTSEVRERLIEKSIHNTILSFLRSKEPNHFYTNCSMLSNLLESKQCPHEIISDKVVVYILNALEYYNLIVQSHHHIALKALSGFLSKLKSMPILVKYDGVDLICHSIVLNFIKFSTAGLILAMKLIHIFASTTIISFVLSREMYEIVVICFDSPSSELSKLALKIIHMHLYHEDCQNYFLEFDGPIIIEKKLYLIDCTDVFHDVLSYLVNLLSVDKLRLAMIYKTDFLKILKSYDEEAINRFPKIRKSLAVVCNFHCALRFHTYGHLLPKNVCDKKFYLIINERGFCVMEHLVHIKASPYFTMYVVDFQDPSIIAQVSEVLDAIEEPAASAPITSRPHTFITNFFRRETFRNFRNTRVLVQEPSTMPGVPTQNITLRKLTSYQDIKYGTLSPDPYLQGYLNIVRNRLVNCDRSQRVSKIALFVAEVIQHPHSASLFKNHINRLKNLLGTNMIPIGYLRFGYGCERSLLFKALADKLDVPASLVRKLSTTTKRYTYWNEVVCNDEDFVVDLLYNVGDLMKLGSLEYFEYCGLMKPDI